MIDKNEICVGYGFQDKDEARIWSIYEKDIKSVMTKEQFKSMEYRLEV